MDAENISQPFTEVLCSEDWGVGMGVAWGENPWKHLMAGKIKKKKINNGFEKKRWKFELKVHDANPRLTKRHQTAERLKEPFVDRRSMVC